MATPLDVPRIEATLRRLVGVEAARVTLSGDELAEIHVVAAPGMRPKHVARDVRSCLAAALDLWVDHKRISVAVCQPEGEEVAAREASGGAAPVLGRVRFGALHVALEADRAEVDVRLEAGGREWRGLANGVAGAGMTERLAVEATLGALQHMVREEIRLAPGDLAVRRLGERPVVLVEVRVVGLRGQRRLVGACPVEDDRCRAAIGATLAALNRTLATVTPSGWTEVRVEGEWRAEEGEE